MSAHLIRRTFLLANRANKTSLVARRNLFQSSISRANIERDSKKDLEVIREDNKSNVSSISGIPEDILKTRKARIFMPARNLMQSGSFKTNVWFLEMDTQERWENPLMGWSSSGDPLSNSFLEFDTKEEAITYAELQGFNYEVEREYKEEMKQKSYGANYSWNKRTRTSTK